MVENLFPIGALLSKLSWLERSADNREAHGSTPRGRLGWAYNCARRANQKVGAPSRHKVGTAQPKGCPPNQKVGTPLAKAAPLPTQFDAESAPEPRNCQQPVQRAR